MKKALAKKMLNEQMGMMPFSESELGEGLAVQSTLKAPKTVSEKYDNFKSLAKAIEIAKKELKEKNKKYKAKFVVLEKQALKARAEAAKMRIEVRRAKANAAPPGMRASDFAELKKKLSAAQAKLAGAKKELKQEQKQEKKDIAAVKEEAEKEIEGDKKELSKQKKIDLKKMKTFEKAAEKNFAMKKGTVAKEEKKVRDLKNKVKHLKSEIKDDKKMAKDMKIGLKAKYEAEERDVIRNEERKVAEQKRKVAGEKQKDEWDKTKAAEASDEAAKEKKVMGEAVKANTGLKEQEQNAENNLKKLEKREEQEVEGATKKVRDLKLKADLEKVSEDNAKTKVSGAKAKYAEKAKEELDMAKKEEAAIKSKADHEIKKMQRKVSNLKQEEKSEVALEKQKAKIKMEQNQIEADKQISAINNREGQFQTKAQEAQKQIEQQKERISALEDKVKNAKNTVKEEERIASRQVKELQKTVKKDAKRIAKRAGLRTVDAAQKVELKSEQTQMKIDEKELETDRKKLAQLTRADDKDSRKAAALQTKLKQEQYKAFLLRKKGQEAKLELKKEKIKERIAEKTAKDSEAIGRNEENRGEKAMFEKYKAEAKLVATVKNQLAQEQSKVALGSSKATKFEAEAQKYKNGMTAAQLHSRRIADRVRKKWAAKLISEQDAHTKEILKLKKLMAVRQTKHDTAVRKLRGQVRRLSSAKSKYKGAAQNEAQQMKYMASQLGEQSTKEHVLQKYMQKSGEQRQRYMKKLVAGYDKQARKLKKKIKDLQNGREVAKLREQIMGMKQQAKADARKRTIKMELKRSQNLDIQSLLYAAIKEAGKGAHNLPPAVARKRVKAAVMAVTQLVGAADKRKGKEIADQAIMDVDQHMPLISGGGAQNARELQQENAKLRAKLARLEAAQQVPIQPTVKEMQQSAAKHQMNKGGKMTRQQKNLMGKLDNLLRLQKLPRRNAKIEEDQPLKKREVSRLLANELGEAAQRRKEESWDLQLENAKKVAGLAPAPDKEVGELEKGAFLVPSED